jgi:hypothetical protein
MRRFCRLATLLISVSVCNSAALSVAADYNEAVNGDFSGDQMNPTVWGSLSAGSHELFGTTFVGDLDYFTINIPSGLQLSNLFMVAYNDGGSGDQTAFIGVQTGTVMTVPPTAQTADGLLGWTHFGPGAGDVGQDILPHIGGQGFGSTGFVPPLPSENYTFWIQQIGTDENVSYEFKFVVTAAGLDGDYNHNQIVGAEDYVIWRDSDGTPGGYDLWRTNFGITGGSGSATSAAVPEPSCAMLLLFVAIAANCRCRKI